MINEEVVYVAAPSREYVLTLWFELQTKVPVDWNDKQSIVSFKNTMDSYSKSWSRLSWADQGWISEQINGRVKHESGSKDTR